MKPKYILHNILLAETSILKNDVFLMLMYATRIPPHILISVNGKLFSLSAKGHLIDADLNLYLRTIQKNRIETIFIKLKTPEIFTIHQLQQIIAKITLSYPQIEAGKITCLAPIKDFCNKIYSTNTSDVNFIFELLPKLEKQNVIGSCYHLNMEKYENNFALKTYTMFEVNEAIYNHSAVIHS